jgi:hypothetical protein
MAKRHLKVTYGNGETRTFKSLKDLHDNFLFLDGKKISGRTIIKMEMV